MLIHTLISIKINSAQRKTLRNKNFNSVSLDTIQSVFQNEKIFSGHNST